VKVATLDCSDMVLPEVAGSTVVFLLIFAALLAFVTEIVPNDATAIGVIAALVLLEPWTQVGTRGAISGFANPATVTIIAMYMLSAGVQNTGVVERLGVYLADFAGGDGYRALVATVGSTGPIAGFVNNTPVVAVFIPMVSELADRTGVSRSKLLLPLSYAAILGGTLTLVGTSTNILASDFARLLIDGRDGIGMFEFTGLGVVVLLVGVAYLLTVGWRLTPARVPVDADPVEEFDLEDHLALLDVPDDADGVGESVDAFDEAHPEVRVLQVRRDGEAVAEPFDGLTLAPGDTLVVHGTLQATNRFREATGLRQRHREAVTEATFEATTDDDTLARAVVPENSRFVESTVAGTGLLDHHRSTVLAIRREGDLIRTGLAETVLQRGDLLLLQTNDAAIDYFVDTGELLVADENALEAALEGEFDADAGAATDADPDADADPEALAPLAPKTPLTLAIMAAVIGAAALDLLPIVIAALAGVFAMVVAGCLTTGEAYDAVSWNVIFLLAGVIPLGLALDATGGATLLADLLVSTEAVLPLVGVLFLFYLVTGLLSNVITPVATVVLMIPVAVDAAVELGANEFSFLLAVTFAAATSFSTPVGYQTNLMVYGPGGYEFTDFLRVGAPLQLLLAVVTTAGIVVRWGL
jgi:di/tricarboxylate transporter